MQGREGRRGRNRWLVRPGAGGGRGPRGCPCRLRASLRWRAGSGGSSGWRGGRSAWGLGRRRRGGSWVGRPSLGCRGGGGCRSWRSRGRSGCWEMLRAGGKLMRKSRTFDDGGWDSLTDRDYHGRSVSQRVTTHPDYWSSRAPALFLLYLPARNLENSLQAIQVVPISHAMQWTLSVTPRSKQFTWDPQVVEEVEEEEEGSARTQHSTFRYLITSVVREQSVGAKKEKKPREEEERANSRERIIDLRRCMKPTHQQSNHKSLILPKGEGAFIHSRRRGAPKVTESCRRLRP